MKDSRHNDFDLRAMPAASLPEETIEVSCPTKTRHMSNGSVSCEAMWPPILCGRYHIYGHFNWARSITCRVESTPEISSESWGEMFLRPIIPPLSVCACHSLPKRIKSMETDEPKIPQLQTLRGRRLRADAVVVGQCHGNLLLDLVY